ncbi:MAG: F0F1 ATP synthase subunit delta [Brevefilum sp.]
MLDIDLVSILAEIFNFLVLAVALYYILFKPIVKRMDENAKKRASLLTTAEEKEHQAQEKLALIEERLENLDQEIEVHLDKAQAQMQDESEALLQATQKEAEKILIEAEKEALKLQQQEIEEFKDEIVASILNISSQVLIRTTPEVVHDNLVEALNKRIWDLGKSDMRQVRTVRDSLAERIPTVHVTSAKDLSPEQQRALIRTFSALADRNVNMEIEIDPELIAGVRVRIGDLILENTLAMELNELKVDVGDSIDENMSNEA